MSADFVVVQDAAGGRRIERAWRLDGFQDFNRAGLDLLVPAIRKADARGATIAWPRVEGFPTCEVRERPATAVPAGTPATREDAERFLAGEVRE